MDGNLTRASLCLSYPKSRANRGSAMFSDVQPCSVATDSPQKISALLIAQRIRVFSELAVGDALFPTIGHLGELLSHRQKWLRKWRLAIAEPEKVVSDHHLPMTANARAAADERR